MTQKFFRTLASCACDWLVYANWKCPMKRSNSNTVLLAYRTENSKIMMRGLRAS
jgi:hypothetical protein